MLTPISPRLTTPPVTQPQRSTAAPSPPPQERLKTEPVLKKAATGIKPIEIQSEITRVHSSIDQVSSSQIQGRAAQFSQMGLVPSGFPRVNVDEIHHMRSQLKPVSQHQVLNLGDVSTGSTTKESAISRKLGSEIKGVPLDRDRLPAAEGSIDIVGHSSDGGMKIEGKSPQQLAAHLKSQFGLEKIKTINLVSCESEPFKAQFQQALSDLGVEVGHVEGAKGRVAADRATGRTLDEAVVGDLGKIDGHDGGLVTQIPQGSGSDQEKIDTAMAIGASETEIDTAAGILKTWLNDAFVAKDGTGKTELVKDIEAFRGGNLVGTETNHFEGKRSGINESVAAIVEQLEKPEITKEAKQRAVTGLNDIHQKTLAFSSQLLPYHPAKFKNVGEMQNALQVLKNDIKGVVDKKVPKNKGSVTLTLDAHGFRIAGRTGISFFGTALKMRDTQPKGHQLRHITSWNNMRDNMETLLNQHRNLGTLPQLETEFNRLLTKAKENPVTNDTARLKRATSQVNGMPGAVTLAAGDKSLMIKAYAILDLAHSCKDNLWSGDGPENQLFGQYKHAVAKKCEKVLTAVGASKTAEFDAFKVKTAETISAIRNDVPATATASAIPGLDSKLRTFLMTLGTHQNISPDVKAAFDDAVKDLPVSPTLADVETFYNAPNTNELMALLDQELAEPQKTALSSLTGEIDLSLATLQREYVIQNILEGDSTQVNTSEVIDSKMALIKESLSFHDTDIQIFDAVDVIAHQIPDVPDLKTQKNDLLGFIEDTYKISIDGDEFNKVLDNLNAIPHGPKRMMEAKKQIAQLIMDEYSPTVEAGRVLDEIRLLSTEPLARVKGFLAEITTHISTDNNLGQFKKDKDGKVNEQQALLATQTLLKVVSQQIPVDPANLVTDFSKALNDRLPSPLSGELSLVLGRLTKLGAYQPEVSTRLDTELTQVNALKRNITQWQQSLIQLNQQKQALPPKQSIKRRLDDTGDAATFAAMAHNKQLDQQILALDAQIQTLDQQINLAEHQGNQLMTQTPGLQGFMHNSQSIRSAVPVGAVDAKATLQECQSYLITRQFDVLLSSY